MSCCITQCQIRHPGLTSSPLPKSYILATAPHTEPAMQTKTKLVYQDLYSVPCHSEALNKSINHCRWLPSNTSSGHYFSKVIAFLNDRGGYPADVERTEKELLHREGGQGKSGWFIWDYFHCSLIAIVSNLWQGVEEKNMKNQLRQQTSTKFLL